MPASYFEASQILPLKLQTEADALGEELRIPQRRSGADERQRGCASREIRNPRHVQGRVDLVARAEDTRRIQEVVPDENAEVRSQVVTDIEAQFRYDGELVL